MSYKSHTAREIDFWWQQWTAATQVSASSCRSFPPYSTYKEACTQTGCKGPLPFKISASLAFFLHDRNIPTNKHVLNMSAVRVGDFLPRPTVPQQGPSGPALLFPIADTATASSCFITPEHLGQALWLPLHPSLVAIPPASSSPACTVSLTGQSPRSGTAVSSIAVFSSGLKR